MHDPSLFLLFRYLGQAPDYLIAPQHHLNARQNPRYFFFLRSKNGFFEVALMGIP